MIDRGELLALYRKLEEMEQERDKLKAENEKVLRVLKQAEDAMRIHLSVSVKLRERIFKLREALVLWSDDDILNEGVRRNSAALALAQDDELEKPS